MLLPFLTVVVDVVCELAKGIIGVMLYADPDITFPLKKLAPLFLELIQLAFQIHLGL